MTMKFLKQDDTGIDNPLLRMEELLSSDADEAVWAPDWWDDGEKRGPKRDAVWVDFVRVYENIVGKLTAVWGPPDFNGGWQDPDYPEWYEAWAPHLAYWRRGANFLFVSCDQQDTETPNWILLGKSPAA